MSTLNQPVQNSSEKLAQPWKNWQKVLFRIAFVFFVIMSLPLGWRWYASFFSINWFHVHYRDIYDIARFSPGLGIVPRQYSLLGYGEWFLILGVAIIAGLIWTFIDRKSKQYNLLYYWLRVIVRYRAGIGIIGFGFTKLLPVQMPYPSFGLLNTHFGDFTSQKIYWLSIGIVPWYQIFAGVVECLAGGLLFFRKTTTLGALLLFGALGDIVFVNFSYNGGVHVYSSYFVLFATFLLIYDAPKIWNLLVLEKVTTPVHFYPSFSEKWLKYSRYTLKTLTIFIFIVLLFYIQYINFKYDPYKQPAIAGIKALRGNYEVTGFKINGEAVPFSPLDTVRWQQVTFENWTTLTFRVNKPNYLDLSNGGGSPMRDVNRTFEIAGTGGGQRAFYYEADTANHVLYLKDKNVAGQRRRQKGKKSSNKEKQSYFLTEEQEYNAIADIALTARRKREIKEERERDPRRRSMVLHYKTNHDGSAVTLWGTDENRDSIYVVLKRTATDYVLNGSSLSAGKYD